MALRTRNRLNKYHLSLFVVLIAYLCLVLFLASGCRTVKTNTVTIHDTITIAKGGSTEYIYKDTGSKITEYLPYFLTVNDTVIQPIFRTIEKAGKTVYKKDTLYIREKYYVNKEVKAVDKKQSNKWVVLPILLLLVLLFITFYKMSRK
jgi:hypothetical protein